MWINIFSSLKFIIDYEVLKNFYQILSGLFISSCMSYHLFYREDLSKTRSEAVF